MARDRDLDDDYDDRPARVAAKGPLDGLFGNTALSVILSVVLFFCCAPIGVVLGGIGVGTAKSAEAKRNATIMLILAGIGLVIGIAGYATNNFGLGGGFGQPGLNQPAR